MIDTLKKGDNLNNFYIFGGSFVGFIIICMTTLCCISKSKPTPKKYSFRAEAYEDLGQKTGLRIVEMDAMIKEMKPSGDSHSRAHMRSGIMGSQTSLEPIDETHEKTGVQNYRSHNPGQNSLNHSRMALVTYEHNDTSMVNNGF